MTLKERLNADFKEAMKNKQAVRKETISFVRAAIKQFEVDNREEIDDAGIASILAKQVKMRKDALADFESAGRTDLIDAYNAEINVLMDYMPKQLTADEIMDIVRQTAQEMGDRTGKRQSFYGKTHGCRDA
ncbi:MAG: GatB/YqeY domain-containing protein [Anaerovoracaceae bacterium]